MTNARKHLPRLTAALTLAAACTACNLPPRSLPRPRFPAQPTPAPADLGAGRSRADQPTHCLRDLSSCRQPYSTAAAACPGGGPILSWSPAPARGSPARCGWQGSRTRPSSKPWWCGWCWMTHPAGFGADHHPDTIGTRGPFEVDVPFDLAGERSALLQVYSASARDGGLTHLSSVGVLLAIGGPADIRPGRAGPGPAADPAAQAGRPHQRRDRPRGGVRPGQLRGNPASPNL